MTKKNAKNTGKKKLDPDGGGTSKSQYVEGPTIPTGGACWRPQPGPALGGVPSQRRSGSGRELFMRLLPTSSFLGTRPCLWTSASSPTPERAVKNKTLQPSSILTPRCTFNSSKRHFSRGKKQKRKKETVFSLKWM